MVSQQCDTVIWEMRLEIWPGALAQIPVVEAAHIPKWSVLLTTPLGRGQKPKKNREIWVPRLQLPKMSHRFQHICCLEGNRPRGSSLLDLDRFCAPWTKDVESFGSLQVQDFIFAEPEPSIDAVPDLVGIASV
jgi:hypothetical protein